MRYVCVSVALLAALVLAFPGPAAAQGKKSADVVKASVKASKPDAEGKQTVTITLNIDKSWHLYANPVANDMLKSAQTTVKFTSKVSDVKIDYPAGTPHKEAGETFKIYEGKVTIKATARRAKGDTSPLQVSVKIQACDAKHCLLPATLKLTAD